MVLLSWHNLPQIYSYTHDNESHFNSYPLNKLITKDAKIGKYIFRKHEKLICKVENYGKSREIFFYDTWTPYEGMICNKKIKINQYKDELSEFKYLIEQYNRKQESKMFLFINHRMKKVENGPYGMVLDYIGNSEIKKSNRFTM